MWNGRQTGRGRFSSAALQLAPGPAFPLVDDSVRLEGRATLTANLTANDHRGAVAFNAAADALQLTGGAFPANNGLYTIAIWVRPKAGTQDPSFLVENDAVGTDLSLSLNAGVPGLLDGNGFIWRVNLGTALLPDVWYFLAMRVNGTTGTITRGAEAEPCTHASGTIVAQGAAFRLWFGGTTSTFWPTADLALIRGWNGVLSDAELEAERKSPTPVRREGLVGDWDLRDDPNKLANTSGGQHLSAPGAGPWASTDGPTFGRDTLLAANLTSVANLVADLTATGGSPALSANLTTAATLSADLTTAIRLSTALAGSATLGASLTTAIALATSATGTATLSAQLTTAIRLAAAPAGSATLTAALTTSIALASSLNGSATLAADLTAGTSSLSANLSGAATLGASLTTGIALSSALTGTAALAGALTTAIRLSASLSGTATLTANLSTGAALLASNLGATATLNASLTTAIRLATSATGSATLSAQITTAITLASTLSGTASLVAYLTAINLSVAETPIRIVVGAERRTLYEPADERRLELHAERRTLHESDERRTLTPPAERRTLWETPP